MITEFDYFRIGTAVPPVRPAAVRRNVAAMVDLAWKAAGAHCDLVLYPELGVTGYTCADLFLSEPLLRAAVDGLLEFAQSTAACPCLFVAGLPLAVGGQVFNCAAAVQRGLDGNASSTGAMLFKEICRLLADMAWNVLQTARLT